MLQLSAALRGCLQGRQLLLVYAYLRGRCAGLLCTHALTRGHQTARSRPKCGMHDTRAASAGGRVRAKAADARAAYPGGWWWGTFFSAYMVQARLLIGQPALPGVPCSWAAAAE